MSSAIIDYLARDIERIAAEDVALRPREGYARSIARAIFEEHGESLEIDRYNEVGGVDLERVLGELRSDQPTWFVQ
jgi:hypothetical protein